MRITVPHYYKKFQCIAGQCPDTCCAGWAIMIDEASLRKYKKRKDSFGNRLKNSIDWKESSFRQYDDRCSFLNEENLCDIYAEAGSAMLCKTCRNYPRHIEEFEGIREISLSLSCPEAAKLILNGESPVRFLSKETEKEESYPVFDFFLFTKLMDSRDLVFSIIQDREIDCFLRMGMVLGFAHDLQTRIDRRELYQVDSLLERYGKKDAKEKLAARLIRYQINGEGRFGGMRKLFGLFSKLEVLKADWPDYISRIGAVLYDGGEAAYEEKRLEFYTYLESGEERWRSWKRWCEQLMVYFVFTYYCGAVYDRQVFDKMKFAVISTLLIQEMAQGLWQENQGVLEPDMFLEAARRYSREVEHSDLNLRRMEEIFHKEEEYRLLKLLPLII